MADEIQVIQVRLPNGTVARIEATVLTPAGPVDEEERRIASVGIPSFAGVLDVVESMAGAIWTVLEKVGPQKASVEFGVEVGLENGQVTGLFVKGSGKANLKITLEWGGRK
jgi:hypothetical protein